MSPKTKIALIQDFRSFCPKGSQPYHAANNIAKSGGAKKLFVFILSILLIGCVGISINPVAVDLAEKILARRIGMELAKANPEIIVPGIAVCDAIMGGTEQANLQTYFEDAKTKLAGYAAGGDKALAADINDLLSMIEIKPASGIPTVDFSKLKTAAAGFKQGLELVSKK